MFGRDRNEDLQALREAGKDLQTRNEGTAEVIDFPRRNVPAERAAESTEAPASDNEDAPIEGEIVDDAETPVQRVDAEIERHLATRADWLGDLAQRAATRQPVIPAWASSRQEAAATLRWVAAFYAHVGAYHATRSPLYLARLGLRAPIGAGRLLSRLVRYALDLEGEPLRYEAAQRNDPETYIKLTRQRDRRVRARLISMVLLSVPAAVALFMVAAAPAWVVGIAVTTAGALLGWAGRPADRQLINRAVLPSQVEPLTSDVVLRALGATAISEISKALSKGEGVTFAAPISRDGPGWRAEVDLPYGVVATDVIERRDKLASGLRRPLGCVWPEPLNEEHPGRLVLWVGQQALNAQPPVSWPLAETGRADLFAPVPFGADVRGRAVELCLMFESVLIGAKPRMGKTFALRVLLLAAALDPTAELRNFELKGTGDLRPVAKVSHDYGSGADNETLARCLASLRSANRELDTRAATISRIAEADPDRCPENKVTAELARAGLGLHPLVIAIDECQELFGHSDKETAKEAAKLAEALIKRGPAMGIILILATQRPDASSLPTGVSANVGIRYCLRVMGQVENDMVLGTSAYRNGVRATMFTAKDKGIGYLDGVADDPQIVRSAYIDGPAAEAIADRARAMRIAAGTLAGYAAGDAPEVADTSNLVDHLLAVWPGDAEEVWSIRLIEALAAYRPETYAPWQEIADEKARATQLANALSPFKVRTKQIKSNGQNKRGVERDALAKVAGL